MLRSMDDGVSTGAKPTAEGTLATRPLSHLLLYVRTHRLSGKLMLRAADGTGGAIAVWRGKIAAARTLPPIAYFGSVASAMGFVDAAVAEAARREAVERRVLHGARLVERGELTPGQRDAVLAEQTSRKIQHLLALPRSSTFAFYGEEPGAVEPPLTLDPVGPLWRAIRDGSPSDDDTSAFLAPFTGMGLRVVNEAPISRAGFSAAEKAICEVLVAKAMTIAQLRTAFPETAPEHIQRVVYLLLLTKSAEPVAAPSDAPPPAVRRRAGSMDEEAIREVLKTSLRPAAPAGTVPSASSAPPRNSAAPAYPSSPTGPPKMASNAPRRVSGSSASPVVAVTPSSGVAAPAAATGPSDLGVAGIALRAQTIEDEDPFDTLGVPTNAPAETARAAYFRLVKVWHPDRLPTDLAAASGAAGKIFAQMTRATTRSRTPKRAAPFSPPAPRGPRFSSDRAPP